MLSTIEASAIDPRRPLAHAVIDRTAVIDRSAAGIVRLRRSRVARRCTRRWLHRGHWVAIHRSHEASHSTYGAPRVQPPELPINCPPNGASSGMLRLWLPSRRYWRGGAAGGLGAMPRVAVWCNLGPRDAPLQPCSRRQLRGGWASKSLATGSNPVTLGATCQSPSAGQPMRKSGCPTWIGLPSRPS